MNHKLLKVVSAIVVVTTIILIAKTFNEKDTPYNDLLIPSEEDIFSHIVTVFNQGIRRPGYPADVWTESYIEEQFKKYGLKDVHKEEVTHHGKDYGEEPEINLKWVSLKTSLIVYNEKESISIPAFSVPYAASTNDAGLDLEIVALESKKENPAAKGKIALYPVEFREGIRHLFYKHISEWHYDPHNTLLGKRQAPVFSLEGNKVMKYAIASGAAGFIGVITGAPDPDMYEYFMPADGTPRPIPGVYISESDGNRIRALMQQGTTRARLISKISLEPFVSHNIIGMLKGKSDDWIIIASHHDAPFYGAVEDASGIAMVLAQAEYWSKVPEDERPHNLLFLIDSGHISGATGGWTFVREHEKLLESVVLEIHLEHIALEYEKRDSKFVSTGESQARWWFISQSNRLIELVKKAIRAEDIERSYIFRPDAIDREKKLPTSDGAFFHRYDVPLVNLVSAPAYLFTSADTLEKVDRESLVPITRAVIRIVRGLDGVSAEQMHFEIKTNSHEFNIGYKVHDFQYVDENGNMQKMTMAIWYPTDAEPILYTYEVGFREYVGRIALNAPISKKDERYPLIVFVHGGYSCGFGSLFFTEYLASQGFIVAAPDYIDTIAPDFEEQVALCRIGEGNVKRFLPVLRVVGKFAETMNADRKVFLWYLSKFRLDQTSALIDNVLELGRKMDSPFYKKIDEDAIGISGHSLGGVTILGLVGGYPEFKDERIKAALLFSSGVYPFEDNIQNIDIPIMIMAGDDDEPMNPEIERKLAYDRANPPKYYLILKDSTHFSFGNTNCGEDTLFECRKSNPQVQVINTYGLAFFEKYLKGDTQANEQLKRSIPALAYYIKEEKPGEVIEWGKEPEKKSGGPGGIRDFLKPIGRKILSFIIILILIGFVIVGAYFWMRKRKQKNI
ncbi:MAG: M28 family peptidase [Candidatus Methanofastidiosia archaeon]